MARKVSLESNSVAYFDSPELVDEPGFYVVEAEPDENEEIEIGRQVFPAKDGDGFVFEQEGAADSEDEE